MFGLAPQFPTTELAPALAPALPSPVIRSVADLPAIMEEAIAMTMLNIILIYVVDYDGKAAILLFDASGNPRLVELRELKEILANRFVRVVAANGAPKLMPAADFWMRHKDRRQVSRALYDPEGRLKRPGEKIHNRWRGFAVKATRRGWTKTRRHLFENVCRCDSKAFRYLTQWLAHAVQRPGTAPGSVVVLKSAAEGSGKTTVGKLLHTMFGPHSLMLNSPDQLLGTFNSHLENISVLVVNEPTFPGDHAAERKFKSMISEDEWLIEAKFRPAHRVRNVAHMLLTTNAPWAVPAGSNARRFFVLDVDDRHAKNPAYFDALYHEIENGGVEAMLGFLLALDISAFRPNHVPVTAALIEQQQLTAACEVLWAWDAVEDPASAQVMFGSFNASATLYDAYQTYAQGRRARPLTKRMFGIWLASLGLTSANRGTGGRGWMLPDAAVFRATVNKAAGIHG